MGLIQSALSAVGSTISDQWKEYFYCDSLGPNVIAVKGQKKVSGFSGNYGNDNVISNGSMISVADGQCMIIVENGQVVEICAEPGEFKYDNTIEPSIFTGNLKDSIKDVFAELGKRFEFGGQPSHDQRVYYFNTKEIVGNKYGTPAPIPFRVVDNNINLDVDISVKCFGEYSYHVVDPILFYTNVCGNFTEPVYNASNIEEMMKSELLNALQPAFAKISEKGIRYSALPSHTVELCDALNEVLNEKWTKLRGIEIVSIGVSSIKANEADEERIKELQLHATLKDPAMAAAHTVGANASAIQDAANNASGAAVGVMGMNMTQQASGVNTADLYAMANNNSQQTVAPTNQWTCPKCGTKNNGNFCGECGEKRPESTKWICPKCGKENEGNFCGNCGEKKPE